MAASIDTITHVGGYQWRFEISGTSPFRWYQDGAHVAFDDDDSNGASTSTDRILEGDDNQEPPVIEVLDNTETQTPLTIANPFRVTLQWRRVLDVVDYVIYQNVGGTFTQLAVVGNDSDKGYYQYETGSLADGTETFRIVARDDRGNTSANLDYDVLVVRNPDVPSISATYSGTTGDLTISSRG